MSFLSLITPTSLISDLLIKTVVDAYKKKSTSNSSTDDNAAEENVEIVSNIVDLQAKAQQELAIARRIMIAETVEITEVYETSGKGGAGLKVEENSTTLGAHGEGRKMTQRIIKFMGFNNKIEAAISSLEESYQLSAASILAKEDAQKEIKKTIS